jgi:hypothetical protein
MLKGQMKRLKESMNHISKKMEFMFFFFHILPYSPVKEEQLRE